MRQSVPTAKAVETQAVTSDACTPAHSTPLLDQIIEQHESPLLAMILNEYGDVQGMVQLTNPPDMDEFEWAMLAQMAWEYVNQLWQGSMAQYLAMAEVLGVDVKTFNRPKRLVQYCVVCGEVGCFEGPQAVRDE